MHEWGHASAGTSSIVTIAYTELPDRAFTKESRVVEEGGVVVEGSSKVGEEVEFVADVLSRKHPVMVVGIPVFCACIVVALSVVHLPCSIVAQDY